MVNQNLELANEHVFAVTPTGAADGDANAYDDANVLHDDLAGFSSIEDLEDFLRTFEAGSETEATFSTQGEGDVEGTPIDTIH